MRWQFLPSPHMAGAMKEGAGLPSQSHRDGGCPQPTVDAASEAAESFPQMDWASAEERLRNIRQALRRERWAQAEEFAVGGMTDGLPLLRLKQAFDAAGKPELFIAALWKQGDIIFRDLTTLAWFARTAATHVGDEYFGKLQQRALERLPAQCRFGPLDYLRAYETVDERVFAALFCIKFGAWACETSSDPFQKAAEYSDRFVVAPETAEFFFRHCRDKSMDFDEWLREFKTSQVLNHLFVDGSSLHRLRRNANPAIRQMVANFSRMGSLESCLDVAEAKRTFEGLDRSRGLLLSTFHSGFLRTSNFFFVNCMPDPFWITAKGEEQSNVVIVQGKERAAAFRTFKALKQGRAVLMAPDGPHYGEASGITIEVLGLKTKVSEGAAVLAYESNCDTGWISAVRRGRMFAPEYVPGPRRAEGEPYKAFRARWVSFYADRIECALSSGPENVVAFSRWALPHSRLWN
ncbi:MAG TPA: hypothetical protein VGM17_13100 [Rhizomicrobium sp.]|jgi:hypothetical protein